MSRKMHNRAWLIVVVLAAIGVLLFVLPHHRGDFSSASLANDFREMVTESQVESPGVVVMMAIVVVGCVGVFLPALLAATIALLPASATRAALILGGIALAISGVLTLFVETLSNMLIGFGGGSKYPETTAVAYLAPLFPLACGAVAIVMGALRIRIP